MTNRLRAVALPLILLFAASCATVTSGDPVVVNAERSVNLAFDTIDTFLYIEHHHAAELAQVSADVHVVAEALRSPRRSRQRFSHTSHSMRLRRLEFSNGRSGHDSPEHP